MMMNKLIIVSIIALAVTRATWGGGKSFEFVDEPIGLE